MKSITYNFILALIVLFSIINYSYADDEGDYQFEITLVADYWCPYNCYEDDEDQGFLVELARRALYPYGIKVNYKVMPWHEALEAVEEGEVDGIIGISDVQGKPLVTTNVPLEYSETYCFTRADTEWVFDGINSLKSKRLGVIMDYVLDDSINSYVRMTFPRDQSAFLIENSELATVESIANLIDGDSDVFIEDARVVNYYTDKNGLDLYLRNAGKISREKLPIYIALNDKKDNARQIIDLLEEGIASLKATGEYDDLRLKYNMDADLGE